jgi:hypothetical protein
MTRFGSISQLLDDLSPRELTDEPVWDDVLARAALLSGSCGDANGRVTQWGGLNSRRGGRRSVRGMRRRPLLVALIVVVCVLVPVSALAVAKNDPWWFLRFQPLGLGPAKGSHVVVIKQGSWNGHSWVLTAYRSGAGQLCFELTENAPNGRHSGQGGGGCAPVPGSSVATPNVRRTLRVTYWPAALLRRTVTAQCATSSGQ